MTVEKKLKLPEWGTLPIAKRALNAWPLILLAPPRSINVGENATWRINTTKGIFALRIYRPKRWTNKQIGVEHAMMAELGVEYGVEPAIKGKDNYSLQVVEGTSYRSALFPWVKGRLFFGKPSKNQLLRLGNYFGQMHQFLCQSKINSTSRNWNEESLLTGPLAETKKIWNSLNCKTSFPKELEEVTDFCLECWHKLNPPKALIHADLHMGNLKWTPTSLNPIDFDDCGIAPLPYDLAVAASSFYGSKSSIDILHNLLEGYASSGAKPITLKELQLFIAIRSIWLMGWIAERPDIFTKDTMRERIEFRSNSLKSFKENFKI